MATSTADWKKFLTAPDAENFIPESWKTFQKEQTKKAGPVLPAFWCLVLLKAFRPDRLLAGSNLFVSAVFGESFTNVNELDLVKIVEKESKSTAPLLFCSAPGYDASSKVEDLAAEMRKQYKVIIFLNT